MHKFDYDGYTQRYLEELCSDDSVSKGMAAWKYWPSEVYSFGRHIRDYAFYPSFLPLLCYTDHGAGDHITIFKHEIETDAPVLFYHTYSMVKKFKAISSRQCYCMLSPFVWYRRKNKISQSSTACGTLAFPSHSTGATEIRYNIDEYIDILLKLPKKFKPVCVCLHMHDINKGDHKQYLKRNIPVYTAGSAFDIRFAERWYNIVKNFKYTTSQIIGSYTYYSVEMEIPFFLYGKVMPLYNISDQNFPLGENIPVFDELHTKIYKIFSEISDKITDEQKIIIENGLGIHDCISRFKMATILYAAYIKHGNILYDTFYMIFKHIIKKNNKLYNLLKIIYRSHLIIKK
jgi:hypothetical protein